VLVAAAADDALSITALADCLGMDRSTLARNLRPLEAQGLIEIGLEGWRRSRALGITNKGRSKLAHALPFWEKAQRALQRKLGKRRWDLIHSDLDGLIRVA
jgi:DNA-binding MarR family transcriptional regulator